MSDERVTIRRIAESLGISVRAANMRSTTGKWQFEEVAGKGGRIRLYAPADLPGDVRDALVARALAARPDPVSISSTAMVVTKIDMASTRVPAIHPSHPVQALAEMKDWQRAIMTCRLVLVREVARLSRLGGKMRAISQIVEGGNAGRLDPELQRAVAGANAKQGSRQPLSATSLRRWVDDFAAAGEDPAALAPAPSPREQHLPPAWLAAFLDFYALPSKPSVVRAAAEVAKHRPEVTLPPNRTIQHHVHKMPAIERARGRLGPRALRQIRAFVRRDVSDLWPTAIYVTDGHTHHAMVAHPLTGKPFRPEITATIDVVTRRLVGWSVALAEATWGTIDALRHAFATSGVPDIWYVDRGSGFNNAVFDDGLTGLLARFDVEKHTSLPYRSQARGVIERFHQTWIEAARTRIGYVGVDMDAEARKRIDKRVAADLAEHGASPALQSWPDFVAWLADEAAAYNDRPHASLDKIADPATGKRRNLTPNEVWGRWLDQGWSPDVVEADDADFRPQERRRTARGEIQLFTNRYFAIELEEFHDCDVLVAYDIHDASKVWVSTLDQRLICVAAWYGNSVSYFPRSVAEQAHEKRVENRLKRVDRKRLAVAEEGQPPTLLLAASQAEPIETPAEPAAPPVLTVVAERPTEPPAPDIRPNFADDVAMVKWLLAHPDRISGHDARYLVERLGSSIFRLRLSADDIDPAALAARLKPLAAQETSS
jgi:putative transposase